MGLAEEIFEDREGFLWIGTVNGLVMYDGYQTTSYMHQPNDSSTLAANNINAISQDHTGRIWVGVSRFGFSVLDKTRKSFIHPCLPDQNGDCSQGISVNAICSDGENAMWVGTSGGLMKFTTSAVPTFIKAFYHDSASQTSLSANYVMQTYVDRKNRLWVGTKDGINLLNTQGDGFVNFHTNPSFPSQQTLDIKEDNKGRIWVTTRYIKESLLVYDEETETFIPAATSRRPYSGEYKITFDQDDNLWVSSRGVGAFHYDLSSNVQTFFDPANYKDHGFRNINSLNTLTDRYGNVWITGNSVQKWPATGKSVSTIRTEENTVLAIYADSVSIWYSDQEPKVLTKRTGNETYLFGTFTPTNIRKGSPENVSSKKSYCIRDLDNDHVLISTTRNIYKWNKVTNSFVEYPLSVGGPIREFVITPDKKHLWLCANQGSPLLFDLATGSYHRPDYASSISNVRCVAQDENGDLWFGSGTSGLFYMDSESHEIIQFAPDDPDPDRRIYNYLVNDIAITEKNIWVATNLGLEMIDKTTKKTVPISAGEFFFSNSFMSILEDDKGYLWLSTNNGLHRYDPASKTITSYDTNDGLINSVYSAGTCHKDSEGHLYFGGDNGIDYFNPDEIGINSIPPDLYLSKILVNNEPLESTDPVFNLNALDLSHTENFIEIELLALHLTSPKTNSYAYRIPEIDSLWRQLGQQRTITLANMRPGNYTLQARAANGDHVWCAKKTLLHISIKPPYWATWWFITLSILFILAAVMLAFRYHIYQVKTRERIKAEFSKQLKELESRALRAQMNPHFLFNSLNSVKSLITQGNTEKATEYITRFAQLIRQILANSEKPFVRLQEELEALRLYLEIEKLRFQNFTYEIHVDENVNVDFIEVPPLILQPYVENAIWHGLMHLTSTDRRLRVVVNQEAQFLHLTIEDNGIGRKQAGEIKSLGASRKQGMGMRITEDRLQLLKTIYGQDVKIVVTDLTDNGQPTGTRVEIRIPYSD